MEIIGTTSHVQRICTGLHSFDRAFVNQAGEVGFPIGKGVEIYGSTHCGKSTITYGFAGMIARILKKDIALADFEGFDPDFLTTVLQSTGFDSKIYCIQEDDDETALDLLLTTLRKPEYCVGIVDSIGAISPVSEAEGDLGESNMGRRAFLIAQFTRKALKILRSPDSKTIFMINHAYPRIGGRGMETPGGEVKKYLTSMRISVKRRYLKGKYEEFPDGSYIIEGQVIKNRWGLKDKGFHLFVLAGYGIHVGLTAMYDLIDMGLVERGRTMKMDGVSFGSLKDVIMKAHDGNEKFFIPFIDKLSNQTTIEPASEDYEQEINETEDVEDTP